MSRIVTDEQFAKDFSLDNLFGQNKEAIIKNVSKAAIVKTLEFPLSNSQLSVNQKEALFQSMDIVDINSHPTLYLRLLLALLKSGNPAKTEHFNFMVNKVANVFQTEFLSSKGKNYLSRI